MFCGVGYITKDKLLLKNYFIHSVMSKYKVTGGKVPIYHRMKYMKRSGTENVEYIGPLVQYHQISLCGVK